jgi:2-hydroxy-6-oxonona-2,4-dienedioate hydrolase
MTTTVASEAKPTAPEAMASAGTVELESTWADVGGLRLHARRAVAHAPPDRPTLVLVHGVAVSSRNMAPCAEAFAPHVPVHSPDLPNHGRSDHADHVLDTAEMAGALVGWLDAAGLDRVHLLGNSYGCQIAAEVAARHPDRVDRLVLQGPTTDPLGRTYPRQIVRWLRNGRHEGSTQSEVTMRDWRDAGAKVLLRTFRDCVRHRIEDVLPRIEAPTLVVRGELDPIVPQRWAEEATALLADGRLAVLGGAGHTITNTHPDAMVEMALPFLLGRDRAPGTRVR